MNETLEKCRIQNWFPRLSAFSLPTSFVYLSPAEIQALAEGKTADDPAAEHAVRRLVSVMSLFSYNRFLGTDLAAPVDSERFMSKRGAVRSAESGWNVLASSKKIREAAQRGEVSCISVRPFRRVDISREFRLFIKCGKLFAMSQYWLTRYFPRIEKRKDEFWQQAVDFVNENSWAFPLQDVAADVYFTSSGRILIMDLNPLEAPTDPLMFNTWEAFQWDKEPMGIRMVPPPHVISGNINVSF